MGCYLNPPKVVEEIGQQLETRGEFGFDGIMGELSTNEVPVGLFQRLDVPWKNAVVLVNENEFKEFDRQSKSGHIRLIGYFGVPIEKCDGYCDWDQERLKNMLERYGTLKGE